MKQKYRPSDVFLDHAAKAKSLVEACLAEAYPSDKADSVERTGEAMRYMIFLGDGGKRLRPALALMAAEACGGDAAAALPYAQGVEEIHTYTLVLDDFQDRSDTRRSMPTCHVHFGINTALLAGQRLFQRGLAPFHRLPEPYQPDVRQLCDLLHQGQAADLDAATWPDDRHTVANLHFIHGGKASALLQLALLGGSVAAGATSRQIEGLQQYGYYLGLAFQTRDDVLGASSTQAEIGKPAGGEVDRNKLTYIRLLGSVEAAQEAAMKLAEAACKYLELSELKDASLLRELADYSVLRGN